MCDTQFIEKALNKRRFGGFMLNGCARANDQALIVVEITCRRKTRRCALARVRGSFAPGDAVTGLCLATCREQSPAHSIAAERVIIYQT
jgi:hypothetical protein